MAELCLSLRKPLSIGAERRLTRSECEALSNLDTSLRPHTGRNWTLKRAKDGLLSLLWRAADGTGATWSIREAASVPPGLASFEPALRTDGSAIVRVTAKVNSARYFAEVHVVRKDDTLAARSSGFETFTGKPVRGSANVKLEDALDTAKAAAIEWLQRVDATRRPTDVVVRLQPMDSNASLGWCVRLREAIPQARITTKPHGTFERDDVLIKDGSGECLLLVQGHSRPVSTVIKTPTAAQVAIVEALRRAGMLVE